MPLRRGHIRVLLVASCGQLLGAVLSTLIGVIMPLIKISLHDDFSSFRQSMICVSELSGIIAGSIIVGKLTEKYGYLLFFRLGPAIIFILSGILLLQLVNRAIRIRVVIIRWMNIYRVFNNVPIQVGRQLRIGSKFRFC